MFFSNFQVSRFLLALLGLICCLACADSASKQQQGAAPAPGALETVFVSGARYGQLTPCECRDNQFGGIDREAMLIAGWGADGARPLLLDAGGFTAPMFNAHEEIKAKFVLRGLGLLGADLVNVCWSDLLLGRETLSDSARENQLKFISANIVDAESGEPAFEPYAVFELGQGAEAGSPAPGPPGESEAEAARINAGRLLVIGLTCDFPEAVKTQTYYGERVERKLQVTDPKAALQRVLAEQRRPDDLVVVLVFVDWEKAEDIFQGVEGVNLAFNSFHYIGESQEDMAGNTRLIASGFQGRFIQEVAISQGGTGAPRVGRVKELKVPAEHAKDPRLTAIVDEYHQEVERVFSGDNPLISPLIGGALGPASGRGDSNRFIGYATCIQCHEMNVKTWELTQHAQAMQTLIDKGRRYDPDCVICHTTGFGKNGYVNLDQTPQLTGVQCEVCHGMGYLHVQERQRIELKTQMLENGMAVEIDPPVHHLSLSFSSEFCIKCHDIDNDASFLFETDLPLISHQYQPPADQAAAADLVDKK